MLNRPDALPYLGKPFAERGRGPDGYDCWGLIITLARQAGTELPDLPPGVNAPCSVDAAGRAAVAAGLFERVAEPCPWAVVAFHDQAPALRRYVSHFGLCVSRTEFVHASRAAGRVLVSRLSDHPWRELREGFYRWK